MDRMTESAVPLRVLVVEDDDDTRNNIEDILALDGHVVIAASTIGEALDRSNWSDIAVALVDRKLPDGMAEDLLPILRERAPKLAPIIATGYGDLDSAISAIQKGAVDYIIKPINPDLLRASLRRIAEVRSAEERIQRSERLAAIGEGMARVVHESRNALQRIHSGMKLLGHKLRGDEAVGSYLDEVWDAYREIAELFEDVRQFAAPLKVETRACDLRDIWREAWDAVAAVAGDRELRIEERISTTPACDVDPPRMKQVFRNLFENAIAACPDPVVVCVSCADLTSNGSSVLEVVVADNGPGLRENQRRKIFESFYTTKNSGTGLGLSIVQRIVHAHGGVIDAAEFRRGCGAEFVITLPR